MLDIFLILKESENRTDTREERTDVEKGINYKAN